MFSMIDPTYVSVCPGYVLKPLRPLTCLVCGAIFQGKGRRQMCSQHCQEIRADQRLRKYHPRRLWTCRACGNAFLTRGQGKYRYCSAACKDEGEAERSRDYREQHRNERRAYDRAYRPRRKPMPHGYWPCEQRAIAEAAARTVARTEATRQARDRHADIVEAGLQIDAWRWETYGGEFYKDARGRPRRYTREQLQVRQDEQAREYRRRRRQLESAALKVYREMGFKAWKRERAMVLRALKAELPTLSIGG